MKNVAADADVFKRRVPGKLSTDRNKLYQSLRAASELGAEYGCLDAHFLSINLKSDSETTGNALKPLREAMAPILGNRPLIWFGVRVPTSPSDTLRPVQCHLHVITLQPPDAAQYLDVAAVVRNVGHPRSLSHKAVDDLHRLMKYLAEWQNLGRAGATVIRSQVVIERMASAIFCNSKAGAGNTVWLPPTAISEVPSSPATSVGFVPSTTIITASAPANANVAGQPTVISPMTAPIDRQQRARPNGVDAQQRSSGTSDIAPTAEVIDAETGEVFATLVISHDLLGDNVIRLDAITSYERGVMPAAVRTATKRALTDRNVTTDTLAAFIGISQPHLENCLSGHDPLSAPAADLLKLWLSTAPTIPVKRRRKVCGSTATMRTANTDLPLFMAA